MSGGRVRSSISRNDPCPCGSGKKFKKCCLGRVGAGAPGEAETGPASPVPVPGGSTQAGAAELMAQGMAHLRAGRLDAAAGSYRHVLAIEPRHAQALYMLGRITGDRGDMHRAVGLLRQSVAADPEFAPAHAFLAEFLLQLGRTDESLAAAARALALDPEDTGPHATVASCHERLNDLDAAVAAVDEALARRPEDSNAGVIRARIDRRRDDLAAARVRLEEIVSRERRPELLSLAYSELGLVLDRLGSYGDAYEAFDAGGRAESTRPQVRAIDARMLTRRIRSYRAGLTAKMLARWKPEDFDEGLPAPVFLVGFARSGTTMTEQVVAAHSEVVTSDEKPLLRAVRVEMGRMLGSDDVPAMLERLDREQILALRRCYREHATQTMGRPLEGIVLVDKNPMDIVELGLINVVFPDARVLMALRDPRDVCVSCFMQAFGMNEAMVNFLSLEGTVDFYARVMDLWLHLRDITTLEILEIRYEDTVSDLEGQARRLLDFLGLAWNDSVLRFHERARERFISTPSAAAVTEPVHRRAIGRWRNYETQFAPLLGRLQRFVAELGYEV